MPRDHRNDLVKKLELQQENNKQRQVDTLLFFQEKVHRRVRTHNDFGNKQCIYEIPMYEIGLPLYDAYWVRNRLLKVLREDGFAVETLGDAGLVLDWTVEKLKEQKNNLKKEKTQKRAAVKQRKKKVVKFKE
tara:strand:- start:2076 stop:2471 length:396 start_codon:yes stop_codon:yes gene_type:complete